MAEETVQPTAAKVAKVQGLDVPFAKNHFKGEVPEGIDPETMLFHGVLPDTKERVVVTLEGLRAEFGDELGEKKYLQIAGMFGGAVFFNPAAEATHYRPPLGIAGLANDEHKQKVAEILAAKE
jgi:hypothetical protein